MQVNCGTLLQEPQSLLPTGTLPKVRQGRDRRQKQSAELVVELGALDRILQRLFVLPCSPHVALLVMGGGKGTTHCANQREVRRVVSSLIVQDAVADALERERIAKSDSSLAGRHLRVYALLTRFPRCQPSRMYLCVIFF